jgi:hypothetical protein
VDNVPLIFNLPSNRTVNTEGAISIKIKSSGRDKTHYMAILASCVDGEKKLSLLLILSRIGVTRD